MQNKLILILLSITLVYSETRILGGFSYNTTTFQDNFSILGEVPIFPDTNFSEELGYANPQPFFGFESKSSNGISGISYMTRGFKYKYIESTPSIEDLFSGEYSENGINDSGIFSGSNTETMAAIKIHYLGAYYILPLSIDPWDLLGIKHFNLNAINFLFGLETGYFWKGKMNVKSSGNVSIYNVIEYADGDYDIDVQIYDLFESSVSETIDRDEWQEQNGDIFDAGLLIGLSYNITSKASVRMTYYYGLVEPREDELSNWSTINILMAYSL